MTEDTNSLEAMAPTTRFSVRAADYRRFRPDYPAAAIDLILSGLDASRLVAADIGAGTGIASRQLAARGVRVIAVEPNADMRGAAEPNEHIEWREGTGEATGLAGGSVGLVLCAQSFHWFSAHDALAEFHRILTDGGRLALMWNTRDRDDPLSRGHIEAVEAVGGRHPMESLELDPVVLAGGLYFTPARLEYFPHAQQLDREGVIGRATSESHVPRDPGPLARLTAMLDALWERHHDEHGLVTLRYVTRVYLATRR
jgi:SAM-dependent methyltransferase